ncbi:unannotated protein [freshwater metagenome]|uniref:pyruvate kinase n=1 Tax=freshwater metagenome TaxID=449393 RepID=A0A6J7DIZ6_9ZZZZ|nr:pyruvate kinase [Actinomycetota bacterium]
MVRRTKIIATIGPVSRDPEVLARMVDAGLDVARLNFSHGTHEEHAETAQLVRDAASRAGRPVAILQDLPGPKIRIGRLEGDKAILRVGDRVTFLPPDEDAIGDATRMNISWPGLADAVSIGELVYLADGSVRLRVREIRAAAGEFDCEVEIGGVVANRQGLNVPGPADQLPSLPEEDLLHLKAGIAMDVDLVALSFVRRPEDVIQLREHTDIPIFAKVEKPQAVARAEDVVRVSDGIMVARGDLGIELPIEEVPLVQKRLLRLCGEHARMSITATQMLDSMIRSARPTRAEVTDVANAILDGTDAVMLSQETAVGAYPVEAIAMMDSIARVTEREAPYQEWNEHRVLRTGRDPAYTIAHGVVQAARELDLAAIVVPTATGRSARLVSAHRPTVPILALSHEPETVRRCAAIWGVRAAPMQNLAVTEEVIAEACRRVLELGWGQPGQRVAITAGMPSGSPGATSMFQVQRLDAV